METFSIAVDSDWVEVASGPFGIQVLGSSSVALYIGSGAPAADTDQFLVIQARSDRSFSIEMEGDTAYVRCLGDGSVRVRGWRA